MLIQTKEKIIELASSAIEPEFLSFLFKYHKNFINLSASQKKRIQFPADWRKLVEKNDELVLLCYPYVAKSEYNRSEGIELSYFDENIGYLYLGNISLVFSIRIPQDSRSNVEIAGYSFKYWHSKTKYLFIDDNLQQIPDNQAVFNLRFDWDENHRGSGLEHHSHFLHTEPRIKGSSDDNASTFFAFIENQMIPIAKMIESGVIDHLGKINRISETD